MSEDGKPKFTPEESKDKETKPILSDIEVVEIMGKISFNFLNTLIGVKGLLQSFITLDRQKRDNEAAYAFSRARFFYDEVVKRIKSNIEFLRQYEHYKGITDIKDIQDRILKALMQISSNMESSDIFLQNGGYEKIEPVIVELLKIGKYDLRQSEFGERHKQSQHLDDDTHRYKHPNYRIPSK